MKNCLGPGDLGPANSQILQDNCWSRAKLLQELLLLQKYGSGEDRRDNADDTQSLCGLIYWKNFNLRDFCREYFKKTLCVKSYHHSEQSLPLLLTQVANRPKGNAALFIKNCQTSLLILNFSSLFAFASLPSPFVSEFSILREEDQLPFQSEHLLSTKEQESIERLFDCY